MNDRSTFAEIGKADTNVKTPNQRLFRTLGEIDWPAVVITFYVGFLVWYIGFF
ncbi:hypothetical protein [Pseudoxanthomonas daejeonensis]|uniref:hypothetical protein n=1 Tax=Pseudoxanthomonas daejeonensis TaxID=266062 RepID=UPI001390E243|nr:hypothetical protein [Pseudoxanthomonas daejeonensis]